MSIPIPNLHTSNKSAVESSAEVFILRRKDANHAGVFTVKGSLKFDPAADDYPSGAMTIKVDLSDSAKGTFVIKSVEQLDTTGKHTPTAYATGRCAADTDAKAVGCRYWLMLADNKREDQQQTSSASSSTTATASAWRTVPGRCPRVTCPSRERANKPGASAASVSR